LDQRELRGGEIWDRAIQLALESCVIVVVFLTPAAVESRNVLDETGFAIDNHKLVLPVLLRACKVPLRLHRLQHVDMTSNEQAGIATIAESIPRHQHKVTPAPAAADAPTPSPLVPSAANPSMPRPPGKPPYWKDAKAMLEYAHQLAVHLGDSSVSQRASEHYKSFCAAVTDYKEGGSSSQDDILKALTTLRDEVHAAWDRVRGPGG
jgi:hypothetical protein